MTPAEWSTLAQTVGVPAAMLITIGLWVGKYLVPTMIKSFEDRNAATYEEHARDRDAFEKATTSFGMAIDRLSKALESRPCWWQKEHADSIRQAGGGE